jgi:hypothetical protein
MLFYLPENIADHDHFLFRMLINVAESCKVVIQSTPKTINVNKESISEKDFFYGFFSLLFRAPREEEKFSFSHDTASSFGAGQAKLLILQKTLKADFADVQNFLPGHLFTDKGGRRLEFEIGAISTGNKSGIGLLYQSIVRLVNIFISTRLDKRWKELAESYTVPTPLVLEGLHRKKVVKVKNKDKVQIKKPKRPSKRIEVLSPTEVKILEITEKPFNEYKDYVNGLEKEIAVSKLKAVRERVSELIRLMWLVVEKASAPLTKRRTPFMKSLSEAERKKHVMNKSFVDQAIQDQYFWHNTDMGDLYTLSPIPLVLKVGSDNMKVAASMCKFLKEKRILVPIDCDPMLADAMLSFAIMSGYKVVHREDRIDKKKGARKVDRFSDESDKEPPGGGKTILGEDT